MITTLPGHIPDLLRRGSPIIAADTFRGVLVEDPTGCSSTLIAVERDEYMVVIRLEMLHALALDLTDPTGRTHAARWIGAQPEQARWAVAAQVFTTGSRIAAMDAIMDAAVWQRDMTDEQIDQLARVVLVLAGRT